jgi:4-hydroxy-tetrahydrodipicolinate synthase
MTARLDGLIAATVLPMNAKGDPDEAGLRRYIGWIAKQGVSGVAINVDTGEGPHLTQSEKVRILEVVREELPKSITLVAGLSGPFTSQAVAQARDYKAIGVDALLVFPISAYLSTPLDPQVPVRYHAAIARVGLPLILFQLQPALGGVNFDQATLSQLCAIDGVVAIKEASFDARRYMDTVAMVRSLPRPITMLTGNDNFIYESFLLGADGALIGFGAIMTREQVELIELAKAKKLEAAAALGHRVQALADVVFAPPVANYRARLKEGLVMLGILEHAYVREPLLPISDGERNRLRGALVEAGLLAPTGLARVAS